MVFKASLLDVKYNLESLLNSKTSSPASIAPEIPKVKKFNNPFPIDLDVFVKKCGGWKKGIFGSKKENGVRIWADIFGKFVSRNGIDFPNFGTFHPDVKLCIEKIADDFKLLKKTLSFMVK